MPRNYGDEYILSYLRCASDSARKSPGVGYGFRIGAALITERKGNWYEGFNSYKTHPKLVTYYRYPVFHAEAHAIIRCGIEYCKDATLFVTRIHKDGSWAIAMPCEECQKLMEVAEIARCFYSVSDGTYGVLDVKS